jgi:hypothetical protein
MPPETTEIYSKFFLEVLATFLNVALIEKGWSMLENRPYSARRVIAIVLVLLGASSYLKMLLRGCVL